MNYSHYIFSDRDRTIPRYNYTLFSQNLLNHDEQRRSNPPWWILEPQLGRPIEANRKVGGRHSTDDDMVPPNPGG